MAKTTFPATFPMLPDDVCVRFGRISVRAAQLDNTLRLLIKGLADLDYHAAMDGTEDDSAAELRRRAKRLARQRLGEGPELIRVQALINRAKHASDRRNDVIHAIVIAPLDPREAKPNDKPDWRTDLEALDTLADDLNQIARDIRMARNKGGWLHTALDAKPMAKRAGRDEESGDS